MVVEGVTRFPDRVERMKNSRNEGGKILSLYDHSGDNPLL